MRSSSGPAAAAMSVLIGFCTMAVKAAPPAAKVAPPKATFAEQHMRQLRTRAWQLFSDLTLSGRPPLRPPDWLQELDAFQVKDPKKAPPDKLLLFFPLELGDLNIPAQTYESTFFNRVAYGHIRDHAYPLNRMDTTDKLVGQSRGEIPEFPPGAVVVKTFWRPVPDHGSAKVGVWKWNLIPDGADQVTEDQWQHKPVCVELNPAPDSKCLRADQYFFTAKTSEANQSEFHCTACPPLPLNQTVILIAAHVASKELADWFWATFWWQGVDRQSGLSQDTASWTCDNAQRLPQLTDSGVWSYFSMDVTTSFKFRKPPAAAAEVGACGAPKQIGTDHEELLAAYNPFIEGTRRLGRKSSCIDCHGRASTNSNPLDMRFYIPEVNAPDTGPLLKDFEGQVRLDYMWSLSRYLKHTPGGN